MRAVLQSHGIDDVDVQPGRSGQFDVLVDGELKYSRYASGRFPSDEEIARLGACRT
ncbi:MAG: Rdx family protein [Burkholderiales bacterium]|nr:Rdx family protein [Burkholderiales bacterium]